MSKELLYATANKGKIWEIGKHLDQFGIKVVSPLDKGMEPLDVSENWSTLEENARAKVEAHRELFPDVIIIADDTGLEIDALNGEPGIHVRRWRDKQTRMSDNEIIDYCLEKLRGVPLEKRGGQFRSIVAIGIPGKETELYEGILRGIIQEQPADFRYEGFPFESLFFIPEWGILLGESHKLPLEEKIKQLSHRERAIQKALPRLKELL